MFQIINKGLIMGVALIFSLLVMAVPATLAGGWAVVTLDELPIEVVTGQPLKIGFMIRQHGRTPWVYDQVMVNATHLQSHEKISVEAKANGALGHYEATLKFPQAGTWRWGIESGLMPMQQPMPDLIVLDSVSAKNVNANTALPDEKAALNTGRGERSSAPLAVGVTGAAGAIGALLLWLRARTPLALALLTVTAVTSAVGFGLAANPAALSMTKIEYERVANLPDPPMATASIELGQALFVAKGCIVCHQHDSVSDIRRLYGLEDFSLGPNLPTLITDPQLLHTWLKDPSALKPETDMPNLELKQPEIEALIAFLLSSKSKADEASSIAIP